MSAGSITADMSYRIIRSPVQTAISNTTLTSAGGGQWKATQALGVTVVVDSGATFGNIFEVERVLTVGADNTNSTVEITRVARLA